jgi:hypothetical protein
LLLDLDLLEQKDLLEAGPGSGSNGPDAGAAV